MADAEDIGSIMECHREPCSEVFPSPPSPPRGEPLQIVLGRRLRWMRLQRALTVKAVASRLGWPVNRISRHERGAGPMHPDELIAYALLYRVRISSFFRDLFVEEP